MLKHEQTLARLQETYSRPGRLEWIGLRTSRRAEVAPVTQARLLADRGLEGDHRSRRATAGKRQVTLVQAEYLPVIAILCELPEVDPAQLRRNLLVSGINLQILKHRRFRIGSAILEGSGDCHPCSRMEENLGRGGYNAVRGHGGITARVIRDGIIHAGDPVDMIISSW